MLENIHKKKNVQTHLDANNDFFVGFLSILFVKYSAMKISKDYFLNDNGNEVDILDVIQDQQI